MNSKNSSFIALLTLAALLSACATSSGPGPNASAQLQATKGNTANGVVLFMQRDNKVVVTGEIRGLKPNTVHGFHVHEKGDCSSGDGMSTAGHFNPSGKAHGEHGTSEQHAGDLLSLKADAKGTAKFNFESTTIAVGSGASDIVGRGLIVHRDPDDYKTQPTGNSGPRVACAVIERSTG